MNVRKIKQLDCTNILNGFNYYTNLDISSVFSGQFCCVKKKAFLALVGSEWFGPKNGKCGVSEKETAETVKKMHIKF